MNLDLKKAFDCNMIIIHSELSDDSQSRLKGVLRYRSLNGKKQSQAIFNSNEHGLFSRFHFSIPVTAKVGSMVSLIGPKRWNRNGVIEPIRDTIESIVAATGPKKMEKRSGAYS